MTSGRLSPLATCFGTRALTLDRPGEVDFLVFGERQYCKACGTTRKNEKRANGLLSCLRWITYCTYETTGGASNKEKKGRLPCVVRDRSVCACLSQPKSSPRFRPKGGCCVADRNRLAGRNCPWGHARGLGKLGGSIRRTTEPESKFTPTLPREVRADCYCSHWWSSSWYYLSRSSFE